MQRDRRFLGQVVEEVRVKPDHSRPSGDAMRFAVVLTFGQRLGSEVVGDPTEPLGAFAAPVATNLAPNVLRKFPSQGLRSKQVSWR